MSQTVEAVFKNTPYSMPPLWDGTVTIYKEWPKWQKDMWYAVLGAPPVAAWVPTFEPHPTEQLTDGNGVTHTYELNPEQFATVATCRELMKRFQASGFASVPFQGAGGNTHGAPDERWLVWPDGTAHNAGTLAVFFVAYPEDQSHYAEDAVRVRIGLARAQGQRLPGNASGISKLGISAPMSLTKRNRK